MLTETCLASVIYRETIYLDTTIYVNILPDLIIISITSTFLRRITITLQHVFVVGAVLGLLIFRVIGMGCEGENGDGEEVGELDCG